MEIGIGRLAFGLVLLGSVLSSGLTRAQVPAASGDAAQAEKVAVEVFQGPKPKPLSSLDYPPRLLLQRKEGWVNLSMMVDPQGKPYEVMVMKSSGDPEFEVEALRAAKFLRFEPALAGDQPIDSAMELKLRFKIDDDGKGAAGSFVQAYRKLSKALEAKDKAAADVAMAKFKVKNLYEDAFMGFAQYMYARQWGTRAEQLAGLKRAIAFENDSDYLPRAMFKHALGMMFPLEVAAGDYSAASKTWEKLSRPSFGTDKSVLEQLLPIAADIKKLRDDPRPVAVAGTIDDGSWNLGLFKHKFRVEVQQGRISEIKLRCEKKYVFFPFDPTLEYTVPRAYGQCHVQLIGDSGTQFVFTQS